MTPVRIPVGSGGPEGGNSAYVLPDRGLVVDPGPPGDAHWGDLLDGLGRAGVEPADVTDVFVTHWHVDHAGLAVRLARAADARLSMGEADAPLVGDYEAERARRLERDARRLAEWGVPADRVEAVVEADEPSPLPATAVVTGRQDGEQVGGLTVLHTPGHTAGHSALADPSQGTLFAGDSLLPTVTPNIGGGDTRQADPLSSYLATLDRLRETAWTDVDAAAVTVYPGHGSGVVYPERLDDIVGHHRDRARDVLATLNDSEPRTPWSVATALFGGMSGPHVKFGAGEAAAHLVRLRRQGRVRRVGDPPHRYVLAADGG